jgi:hypothetical protein
VHPEGDLARLLGVTRRDSERALVARRPDAQAPRPGSLLIIGDSQMERSLLDPTGAPGAPPLRDALIPGTVTCNWDQMDSGACDAMLLAARTVVIESVARDVHDLAYYRCWRPIALAAEGLRGAPGTWLDPLGKPIATRAGDLVIPKSGSLQVTIRPPDGSVSGTPRLERLPIVSFPPQAAGAPAPAIAVAQTPTSGQPAPCAMPEQSVVGAGLFIPIPATRDLKTLVLTVAGPPGAVVGRPQTIVLDGKPATGPT